MFQIRTVKTSKHVLDCEETTHDDQQNKFVVSASMGHDKIVVLESTIANCWFTWKYIPIFSVKKIRDSETSQ